LTGIDSRAESILIVDDQEAMRRMIADFLNGRQYQVLTAGTGEDAVELFGRHSSIAVVLLGLGADPPGPHGPRALTRLLAQTPRPSVVLVTDAGDPAALDAAMRLGAFDYLLKPINMASLEVVIEAALADYGDRNSRQIR
jgi:DNA-binding NtrC family response regulator